MTAPIVEQWITPCWPAPASVRAAFITRVGGVSQAPYDSMNLSSFVADAPADVAANRAHLARVLGLDAPVCWLRQVHGTEVLDAVDALHTAEANRSADGACAQSTGVVCAVMAADCLPVLLCDRAGQRVAAVHAGWRGLAAGALEAGVAALGRLGAPPAELLAWLGPCIGAGGSGIYEVGDEVRAAFSGAEDAPCFAPSPAGRWLADLPALAHLRLREIGVEALFGEPACTYSDPARFFSHRRDGPCGRMAALIWRNT